MKRIISLLLACVMLAVLSPAAFASALGSVTVSSFPSPEAGKAPSSSMTVSDGTVKAVEWFLADGGVKSEVAMAAGETFRAGHTYAAYLYIDPPSGREWKPLSTGEITFTDMSDVTAKVTDDSGKNLPVSGNYLDQGRLLLRVEILCPGEPHDEELPGDDPTPLTPAPVKERPDFGDVNPSDWYYNWVYGAADLGLVNGKGKGDDGRDRFDPTGSITFAETAKLAACLHQLYTAGAVTLQNGDPWYKTYVDYCAASGILASTSENGSITADDVMKRASETVTRGEFAWIFAHALPAAALSGKNNVPDNAIPDVKTGSGFFVSSVYTLYRAGILNGSDDAGTFHPSEPIQRCAVAAISVRMIQADQRVGAPKNLQG